MSTNQEPDVEAREAASLLEEYEAPASVQGPTKLRMIGVVGGSLACALMGTTLIASSPHSASKASVGDVTGFEENDTAGDDDFSACSWGRQNCTATQCCNNPGHQCYYQNSQTNYAQCRESCIPNAPDPSHWDSLEWTCEELGERSEGDATCSDLGEDCRETRCCIRENTQCFEKNEGWATCKVSCAKDAPDLGDLDSHPWTCNALGPRALDPAPWVDHLCAKDGEDCRSSKCCASPGAQCYSQNNDWAACKYDCTPGKDPDRFWEPEWSCDEIGARTPGMGPPAASTVAAWVKDECAWDGNDCHASKCCIGVNKQCYEKNDDWATCMESCTPGPNPFDGNASWSCRELGVRSNGLAVKGDPALYCWSLFQTTTYEMDIIKFQLNSGYGIFQCDEYSLLSTDEVTDLGKDVEGKTVKTLKVDPAVITTSVDGTAGNAQLFVNTWNVVVQAGHWNNHAWTVKVDPDAVLIADRLRLHLAGHHLENVYVVNCNKFPSSPNFPMMYGSVEIYSWKAIQTYANHMNLCMADMASMLPLWGEDYFMTHCLDHIGVGRISDFTSVGDNVCTGANCFDAWVSAFHPYKDVASWKQCWNEAHGIPNDE